MGRRCDDCGAEILWGNGCACRLVILSEIPKATTYVCGGEGITPEARAELQQFASWLKIPKPRIPFDQWRTLPWPA
jgi:hypothetical protein